MNKATKVQLRKYHESREGLTLDEIQRLDEQEALEQTIMRLAKEIHLDKFPEEYDFMYDSIADANDRKHGKNPMNADYIAKVNAKREALGLTLLSTSGKVDSDDSWRLAYAQAKAKIGRAKNE